MSYFLRYLCHILLRYFMIHLIGRTNYSKDSVNKLWLYNSRPFDSFDPIVRHSHEFYTFACRADYEIADMLREFNILFVSNSEGLVIFSGNITQIRQLYLLLNNSGTLAKNFARYLHQALPEIHTKV